MPAVLRKLLSILAFFICFSSLPALAAGLATDDTTLDSGSGTCAPGKVPQTQNHFIGADRADFGKVADLGVNIQALEVPEDIEHLPPGSKGIAMVAQCTGVTQAFKDRITAHSSRDPDGTKIAAYWIGEEPQLSFCDPANLKAQADWIHENVPNGKTMAVLFEPSKPYGKYAESMDYVGVDPYPCKGGGACDYSYITRVANAMISDGVPREKIIPFYQSFGLADGENPQAQLNNVDQAKQLETWAAITPNPPFDNVWTWKPYGALLTLEDAPEQQAFFREMNACLAGMQPTEQPVAQPTEQPVTQPTEQPAQPTGARAERLGEFETRDNEFSASIDRFKKSKKTDDPRFADTLSRYEDMQARWSDFRGDPSPAIECEGATKAEKAAWIAAAGEKNWDFSCPEGNTTAETPAVKGMTQQTATSQGETATDAISDPSAGDSTSPIGNYQLTWQGNGVSDFATQEPWDTGRGCTGGFGDACMDPDNVSEAGGVITLAGEPCNEGGKSYCGSVINTRGIKDFTEGYVEVTAKTPTSQGAFHAAGWLLGNGTGAEGWPNTGEIDFAEGVNNGNENGKVYFTAHWGGEGCPGGHCSLAAEGAPVVTNSEWNTYGLERTPTSLTQYVNGEKTGEITRDMVSAKGGNYDVLFNAPMHYVADMAAGGPWAAPNGGTLEAGSVQIKDVNVYE